MRWRFGAQKKKDPESDKQDRDASDESAQGPESSNIQRKEVIDVNDTSIATPASKTKTWLARLRKGLAKSSSQISTGISAIFKKRVLDDETLEELEELLISADLGAKLAGKLTADLAKSRFGKEVSEQEIKEVLAGQIIELLTPVTQPLQLQNELKPECILFVGVNGSGKTTTIGKIAQKQRAAGKSIMLAAGDTFRAAAAEQLKIWGQRTDSLVIEAEANSDPSGLAYEAMEKAQSLGQDLLLVDTAGRLHNRQELMEELAKMMRVIKKVDSAAPHHVILVLDATIGQNALAQVRAFNEMVTISGLIVTKLDGTAKGGVVVALAQEFGLPVHAVGIGEDADDLRPFDAKEFAYALVGLDETTQV